MRKWDLNYKKTKAKSQRIVNCLGHKEEIRIREKNIQKGEVNLRKTEGHND